MRDFIPWLIGMASAVWYKQRSGISLGPLAGVPPVDYTILNQQQLLASFSDAIGPDGITPRSLRNLVASTVTSNPGGSPPSAPMPMPGWTTSTRPTGMPGPAFGFNYDTGQMEIWNPQSGTWVSPAFTGGTVPNPTTFLSVVTRHGVTTARGGI